MVLVIRHIPGPPGSGSVHGFKCWSLSSSSHVQSSEGASLPSGYHPPLLSPGLHRRLGSLMLGASLGPSRGCASPLARAP
eukprot:1366465-Rhodomonas_salina.2